MIASERLEFLHQHLYLPEVTGIEYSDFDPWQLELLCDDSRFSIDVKSRQIGWSMITALETLAECYLHPGHLAVFVSYRLDDAREKIRYLSAGEEALYGIRRMKRVTSTSTEIEWDNGSRAISLSSKPPRGKAGSVYLDELAFCSDDDEIYKAAQKMLLRREKARLRIGSTPAGKSGIFWEIATESMKPYPGFSRRRIPWWKVPMFCNDVDLASQIADQLSTKERIERFGKEMLVEIYRNAPEEDFQQECECSFQDELYAWISWEMIRKCQNESLLCWKAQVQAEAIEPALNTLDQLAAAQSTIHEAGWFAGLDIGRKKDRTELIVLSRDSDGKVHYRLSFSLQNTPFSTQATLISQVLKAIPSLQLRIDRNGIGMMLAEQLEQEFGWRVRGENFTSASKENWAVITRLAFDTGKIEIPVDRELASQIHSIRRSISGGKTSFDCEASEKHHADQFWALALALSAAESPAVGFSKLREGYTR